jgi:hypothetical protein
VPHRIDAALIGDPTGQARTVDAVQRVAKGSLVFRQYPSVPTALHAIDEQNVYAALDLTSESPTLYMASAAGASVAHMLEGISAVDPTVRVVDTHPLGTADPNGLVVFYLMLVATIAGFFTVFQVRQNAAGLSLGQWAVFVVALPVAASFVWLPSGATVTALREAAYFPTYQHAHPIVVIATWTTALLVAMLLVSHRLGRSPGDP